MRFRKRQLGLLFLAIGGLVILRRLCTAISPFLSVQLHHLQWNHHAILYSIWGAGLLSKEPLVQIINEETVDLVFEIRHDPKAFGDQTSGLPSAGVVWNTGTRSADEISFATMTHDEMEIFVYRARLSDSRIARSGGFWYHLEIGNWKSKRFFADLPFATDLPGPFRIGVIGDNQFAAVRFTGVLRQMVQTGGPLDMMIHVGDAVQDAPSARSWSTDFWDPIRRYGLLKLPWIMLRGNHDSPSAYTSNPHIVDARIGCTSFYLARAKTFFLILDSNSDSELQDRFLLRELKSDRAQSASRRIVLVHIPPFVEYWDPIPWKAGEKLWGAFVRTRWVPIFASQHVDMVISGHQHNYQRGKKNNVHYFITGGAGGTLDDEMVEHYDMEDSVTFIRHHFAVLEVDEQTGIRWRMYLEDGSLADEVTI